MEIEGRHADAVQPGQGAVPGHRASPRPAVVDYYARIAPVMLPHLRGRPLTLVRYPDGVDGERFFEKRCPPSAPEWVRSGRRARVRARRGAGHPGLARQPRRARAPHPPAHRSRAGPADAVVLDLDPGPPATVLDCARVALELHAAARAARARAVVKTSGSKGLHLSHPDRDRHRDRRRHQGASPSRSARCSPDAAPERVTIDDGQGPATREGVRRLEPERPAQDDGRRVLAARPAASDRLDPGRPGTRSPTPSTRPITRRLAFEIDDVLARVADLGDLYADEPAGDQTLPSSADASR